MILLTTKQKGWCIGTKLNALNSQSTLGDTLNSSLERRSYAPNITLVFNLTINGNSTTKGCDNDKKRWKFWQRKNPTRPNRYTAVKEKGHETYKLLTSRPNRPISRNEARWKQQTAILKTEWPNWIANSKLTRKHKLYSVNNRQTDISNP